jgi:hypothetical protein
MGLLTAGPSDLGFKMSQHQIVLKLVPRGSKVYASGKFVRGLFVGSLSVERQILNNQARRIG